MGTIPAFPIFTPGEVPTASKLNQYATAAAFWSLTPRCYAYDNAGFSVPNGAYTAVPLTAEVYDIIQAGDTASHDNVTANTKIFARTAGKYEVASSLTFLSSATGVRSGRVLLNGSTTVEYAFGTQGAINGNVTQVPLPAVEMVLAAGDYLELQAFQNQTSGSLALAPGPGKTFLRIKLTGS